MSDEDIKKYFSGSRLSILSIANILGQPKESTRRRVQKLIDYQLLKKDDNNGIMLGENYTRLVNKFADKTAAELYKLTTRLGKINWYQKKEEETL
jgi:DNA-binding IclR family transcriptional regulator